MQARIVIFGMQDDYNVLYPGIAKEPSLAYSSGQGLSLNSISLFIISSYCEIVL